MRAGYTRFVTTWTERLYAFVNRWYAAPLRAGDGNSDLEISAVERELGDRLPEVLRDWYRLVGRRLRPAQDMPTRLSELVERRAWAELPGHVVVWNENQGCWRVEVPLGDAADPPARLKPDDDRWIGGATSEVLLSMLLSDTVMGPGFDPGQHELSSLGPLAAHVVGGYRDEEQGEHLEELVTNTLPSIAPPANPALAGCWYGDDELIVVYLQPGWAWMASGDAAAARARVLLRP